MLRKNVSQLKTLQYYWVGLDWWMFWRDINCILSNGVPPAVHSCQQRKICNKKTLQLCSSGRKFANCANVYIWNCKTAQLFNCRNVKVWKCAAVQQCSCAEMSALLQPFPLSFYPFHQNPIAHWPLHWKQLISIFVLHVKLIGHITNWLLTPINNLKSRGNHQSMQRRSTFSAAICNFL